MKSVSMWKGTLATVVLVQKLYSIQAWIPRSCASLVAATPCLRLASLNGEEIVPELSTREEEETPRIQPIQPGMQEAPMYVNPPESMSIQPMNTPLDDLNGDSLGLRSVNGRTIRSTNNQLDENRAKGYEDPGTERVQGNSLRTYDNPMGGTETNVNLKTQGRPIHADLQMWAGPNNVPKSVHLYSQDGSQYGVSTSFSTSNSQRANSVSIRNQANMEFPLTARVTSDADTATAAGGGQSQIDGAIQPQQPQQPRCIEDEGGVLIQGEGMVKTFPIAANVQKVQIILQSSGMSGNRRLPIMATVELLQGPNNVKTRAEIYDDGLHGDHFETVFDTPGFTSSIRIKNTGPMTYPFHVLVLPHTFGEPKPLANDVNDISQSRFGPDGRFRG
jgi:hypothetical protein